MKAGDVCVQRGTIHGWTNYSDKPARVYFILTGRPNSKSVVWLYMLVADIFNSCCSGQSWRERATR
jgi:hypothetical protein